MKLFKYAILGLTGIILIAGIVLLYQIFGHYDIGPETKSIMVEQDDTFAKVIGELKEKGIIDGDYLFRRMAIIMGADKQLQRGRYDFQGSVSIYEILRKFKNHDKYVVKLTIPEGLTVYRTAGIIANRLDLDSTAFVARAFDTAYNQRTYNLPNLEGYLYPETYFFPYGLTIDEVQSNLVEQFRKQTDGLLSSDSENGLSSNDIVTLASIIEAEAMYDDEKPVISSVYNNRLKRKMLLQADPTVIYALGGLDRPLWYRDLKYDSPYNTYKYKGLPPGPINSPGLEAIKAAINPEDTDYLYFVADGSGRHIFSKTLNEHNRAKRIAKRNKSN